MDYQNTIYYKHQNAQENYFELNQFDFEPEPQEACTAARQVSEMFFNSVYPTVAPTIPVLNEQKFIPNESAFLAPDFGFLQLDIPKGPIMGPFYPQTRDILVQEETYSEYANNFQPLSKTLKHSNAIPTDLIPILEFDLSSHNLRSSGEGPIQRNLPRANIIRFRSEDSIDPLSPDRYHSYLSGSSVLTFDNMGSNGCLSNYSSTTVENDVITRPQDFEKYIHGKVEHSEAFFNPSYQIDSARVCKGPGTPVDVSPYESSDRSELSTLKKLQSWESSEFETKSTTSIASDREEYRALAAEKSTEIEQSTQSKNKTGFMRSRSHKCHVCQKTFKRPSSFRIHYAIHTGEKDYQCDWPGCGKLFNVKSNMTRHQKVHLKKVGKKR
ncbi:hypothetical protein PUMCH_004182 [Australozyma saopauloensis]|uniref:C2H2-type domain-containing protein n=1 Tax=Australozyma saopauloensis TaxID=291208 RepID=A0AAX4HGQ4_9ASCO|nr:hypothetical protein PUMCH_004182 [[Candida] saopauloensis]